MTMEKLDLSSYEVTIKFTKKDGEIMELSFDGLVTEMEECWGYDGYDSADVRVKIVGPMTIAHSDGFDNPLLGGCGG